jgi:hypothetical protein
MTNTTETKQNLIKQFDELVSDLGYSEIRIDELLRELEYISPGQYPLICKDAERITKDLIASVNKFNATIKKLKQ